MSCIIIGIYKITNPSGRSYIGQSINVEARHNQYYKLSNCNRQPKLYNSFLKYGVLSHSFEIIEECSVELLNERERYWQEFYDCVNNGLNCMYTETNEKKKEFSIETIFIMRNKRKGIKQANEHILKRVTSKKGYKHSNETKEKIAKKRSKLILDLYTGIFYENSIFACRAMNYKESTLRAMLVGRIKNKTNLIYV